MTWKAAAGITDDVKAARYEVGEVVPAELVKRAPWLVEDGHVIDAKDFDTQSAADSVQDEPAAVELDEDTVAVEPAGEEA
jgi:hypothetical protein